MRRVRDAGRVVRTVKVIPARSSAGFQTFSRNQSRGMWPSVSTTRGRRGESLPAARRCAR